MKNTNKSKRYLINASYGACAEAEQVFRNGGDSILHGADVFIVETGSKGVSGRFLAEMGQQRGLRGVPMETVGAASAL